MTTDTIREAEYRLQLARAAARLTDELARVLHTLGRMDSHDKDAYSILTAALIADRPIVEAGLERAQTELGYLTGAIPRPEPETVTRHRDAGSGRYVTEAEADARPETTVSETREVGR